MIALVFKGQRGAGVKPVGFGLGVIFKVLFYLKGAGSRRYFNLESGWSSFQISGLLRSDDGGLWFVSVDMSMYWSTERGFVYHG